MDKKVFIILLNYKGVEDTLQCVKSLEEIDYTNYEIVIVDNASPDNSFEVLKENLGSKHMVMSSGRNGGFAFGNNVGIEYALKNGAEYILLLNNDTIVEKDFLKPLVSSLEADSFIGISTGLILNYFNKEKVWFAGGELNWKKFYGYHLYENNNIEDIKDKNKSRVITFATGCLMLIRAKVLTEVGLLPEEYFMYYEDVDYCAKVQEKGYKIFYNPSSIIYHKISASTGEGESPFAVAWNTRNRIKFMKKYKNKVSIYDYYFSKIFFYGTRLIIIVKYLLMRRKDKVKALIKGLCNKEIKL